MDNKDYLDKLIDLQKVVKRIDYFNLKKLLNNIIRKIQELGYKNL